LSAALSSPSHVPNKSHAGYIINVKTSKLFLASLFALAAVQMASAQIEIRVTGSTAFRGAVHTAIGNILNPGYTVGFAGSSLNGASQAIFKGTTISGAINVIIKTAWSGSVGGVFSLTTGNGIPDATATPAITVGFLVDGATTSVPPGTQISASAINAPNALLETVSAPAALDKAGFPNVGLSDSFQSSTPYRPGLPPPATQYPQLLASTAGELVGVIPFQWVKNVGAPATLIGITNQLATAILINGNIPLSQFTGNAADATTNIYVTGRNNDSGTRLDAFAESGFGINSPPLQVDPTQAGADHIASGAWVAGAAGVVYYNPASTGRSSGGQVAGDLNATGSQGVLAGNGSLISYLGVSDAATVNGGANTLAYNGALYSVAAVQNGQYSFWAYEHLFLAPTFTGVPANSPYRTVVNALAARILNFDAGVSGIPYLSMNVARQIEGGVIF
jgi:hypothetical protein